MRSPRPAIARGLAVVVVLSTLAACGVSTGERGSVGHADVVGIPDDPNTTVTTAPLPDLPPPDVEIIGDDGSDLNVVAANAIADIEAWWAVEYPKQTGEPYKPVSGGFYAVGPDSDHAKLPCGPLEWTDVQMNAYYCFFSDGIAWDQHVLFPFLERKYGSFAVPFVMAHEWGHAIQGRAGLRNMPTIVKELQADCFAGAWVKHVRVDPASRFRITIEDLDRALGGIIFLRDDPGGTSDDPNAHGSGFDRVGAFQDGYEQGVSRCFEYDTTDPEPFLFPFTSSDDLASGGDLPLGGDGVTEGITDLAFDSLDAFWADEFPELSDGEEWTPLDGGRPFRSRAPLTCGGQEVTNFRLFVCMPERYVGYEIDEFIPEAYELGDLAVAVLFAGQYGLAVQEQLGAMPEDQITATLRGDCYAGAWAGALLPPNSNEDYLLTLSPGDLDEGVDSLLNNRLDGDRERQGPGFDRARAFRVGVVDGSAACGDVRPSE